MDFEQSHQELVKCVVVGDTAVGKTRLICAKACNLILDLNQLMTTHIPTVWAIDQYRIHKEVLERSWEMVDGVNVSLRLWDTFGDHDKDRRFAYGRSDVVLLCFSIANPLSLRNCKTVWYPEIRKFCPNTPIVLVGCKNDLRHMFRDEKFQTLCRERSPFFRPLKECDILTPEQGRLMAKELNAPYYETSVFTGYGVKEVFENVIRSALISRRHQRFWMTNLKHVRNCLIQEPFCPPKPPFPQLKVPQSQYHQDMRSLLLKQAYTDAVFVNNNSSSPIYCHKIVLVAASDTFHTLFTYHHYNQTKPRHHYHHHHHQNHCRHQHQTNIDDYESWKASMSNENQSSLCKWSSDMSIASSSIDDFDRQKHKLFNDDSLLDVRISRHFKNFLSASLLVPLLSFDTTKLFKHSFAKTNRLFSCNNGSKFGQSKPRFKLLQQKLITVYKNVKNFRTDNIALKSRCQSIISFGKNLSFEALQTFILLVYSFNCKNIEFDSMSYQDIARCLRVLDFVDFDTLPADDFPSTSSSSSLQLLSLSDSIKCRLRRYIDEVKGEIFPKRIAFLGIDKGLFSDVIFKLDDGTCYGHKAIMMSRCEVMEAMFKGDFKESSAQMIVFPGVTRETFYNMLYYIYTDKLVESVNHKNCIQLIELANRFCLTRLIALTEERVITELIQLEMHSDINAAVLKLLEPCQIHNADQLSDFCLYHITINYNEICHTNMKLLRSLHPENQAYLNRNRWPPVWFLKERDYFERCVREREWNENPKSFKRAKMNSGCFCFTGGKPKLGRNSLANGHFVSYPGLIYKLI
ncbi:Rho- BTB domain-containing protein 1 [Blomia tropicalis]|nr:Rho- BTB domain-containing protein 1 [Blomia tropicalis]